MCHAELSFNAFFTLELLLRAGASGGPRAYLSNAWNIFDLLMVLAGYTEFLPASWFGMDHSSAELLIKSEMLPVQEAKASCLQRYDQFAMSKVILQFTK